MLGSAFREVGTNGRDFFGGDLACLGKVVAGGLREDVELDLRLRSTGAGDDFGSVGQSVNQHIAFREIETADDGAGSGVNRFA